MGEIALSIIIPVFNEEKNIAGLAEEIFALRGRIPQDFEVIWVDDGSTDDSFTALTQIALANVRCKIIRLRKNFGQTAAISAGLAAARGTIFVLLDGDGQNDPADIPALLEKIAAGFDVASGWRKLRQDTFLTRTLPSRIANRLISVWTGVSLNDYGCTLKAYRREVLEDVRLYGEMHRFMPYFAHLSGARIAEVPVNHRPRRYGHSHYGLARTFKVLLDMITIRFLGRHAQNPIYIFGGAGFAAIFLGVLLAAYTLYQKFHWHVFVHKNPLILLASLLALAGLQLVVMGLLAEILIRTYHESQNKPIYRIRDTVNFEVRN